MGWRGLHDNATPNRSETNGVVELANRTNQNGISVALVQSGLSPSWWPEAARYFAFMHQIQEISKPPDVTPWRDRFGKDYDGPRIPFGAAIRYRPSSKAGQQLLPKFGEKALPGIFIG